MTAFEIFAQEIGVVITTDNNGFYTGLCKALAVMTTEIILSDNDAIFELPWEVQKEMIADKFYKIFPYMKK